MFNKPICLTLCVVFFAAILVACSQGVDPTQTSLPHPTNTLAASATANPTSTPTASSHTDTNCQSHSNPHQDSDSSRE